MATTEDEKAQSQREQQEAVVAKSVTEKDVVSAYVSGKNYYDLANEFFGFDSEEAVARIHAIVSKNIPQDS